MLQLESKKTCLLCELFSVVSLLLTQIHLRVGLTWKFSVSCAEPKNSPRTVASVLYLQTEITTDVKWEKILFPLENESFFLEVCIKNLFKP